MWEIDRRRIKKIKRKSKDRCAFDRRTKNIKKVKVKRSVPSIKGLGSMEQDYLGGGN